MREPQRSVSISHAPALRQDGAFWIGLVGLLLGICLIDRGFAFWRNDGANFRDANGRFYVPKQGAKRTWEDSHLVQRTFAGSGLVLLLFSVGLLGRGEDDVESSS